MSGRGSYRLLGFLEQLRRNKWRSGNIWEGHCSGHPGVMAAALGHGYYNIRQVFSGDSETWRRHNTNMIKDGKDMVPPPVPPPPRSSFPQWARWVLGSVLSILLPFWKPKWENLRKIEGEAEVIVEEIEGVAEVVGKVANVVEKVSAEVADKLPENGKLKEAALLVERVSKATAKDAQLTKDVIHKVEEVKNDMDDLESLVEPIITKIIDQDSKRKVI